MTVLLGMEDDLERRPWMLWLVAILLPNALLGVGATLKRWDR